MSDEPLDRSGLIPIELGCRICGARQVWALPAEVLVSGGHHDLACFVCEARGALVLPEEKNNAR